MRARRILACAVAGLCAVLLAACGTAAGAPADDGRILRYGVDLTPGGGPIFDPIQASRSLTPNQNAWLDLIYDRLIYRDDDGTLRPGLLTSWEAPDPLTAVLTVREGVRFQDGTPLDAAAIAFNWERDLAEPTLAKSPDFRAFESLEVVSPSVLKVHYKTPVTAYAFNVTFTRSSSFGQIASPTAVRALGAGYGAAPVGAGPYRFEKLDRGSLLSVRRWDGYWNPSVQHLDGIDFVQNGRGAPMISALAAGRIDIAPISLSDIPVVRSREGLTTLVKPGNEVLYMQLRVDRPPFDDIRVREALAWAFDRKMINDVAYAGAGEPTRTLYFPGSPYHDAALDSPPPFDAAKGRELLAAAGYPDGFRIGMLVQNQPVMVAAAEVLQAQLDQIGVEVEINVSPNYINDALAKPDSIMASTTSFAVADSFLVTKARLGLGYSSPAFDAAYAATLGATGREAEIVANAGLQKVIIDETPIFFLAQEPIAVGMRAGVTGVTEVRGDLEGPDLRDVSFGPRP
ncbi:MAG: ABC transporter substrate-binding protein [Pseudonocardia sp.]|nr:ABC transporter substrate-binding protein [Pseudonocardia sp.]